MGYVIKIYVYIFLSHQLLAHDVEARVRVQEVGNHYNSGR